MADPGAFKRPLYPPSHPKGPVPNGADVEAVKRAVSRAGYFPWQEFDRAYNEKIADAVVAFQKAKGLGGDSGGAFGEPTFSKLKSSKVPKGSPNAGEACFDQKAADLYRNYKVPPAGSNVDRIRAALTEFCTKGLGSSKWEYSQNREVDISVDPTAYVESDCSGSVIQAFDYARRKTNLPIPDPSKQGWSGYGNTSYYEDDHPTVTGSYLVGDLAHYDGHVCLCIKAGSWDSSDWWSFGSEPPSKRKLNYRSDFRKVVRPPLQ